MTGITNASTTRAIAALSVTYPEGSVCKCYQGNLTFTATDRIGKMLFLLPKDGAWTVEITDGTRTKTKTVEVATSDAHDMSIQYVLLLYNEGDMNLPVTGGWQSRALASFGKANPPYITINANSVTIHARYIADTESSGIYETINDIDLTPYTQISVETETIGSYRGAGYYIVVLNRNAPSAADADIAAVAQIDKSSVTELDISNLSGNYDIGIRTVNFYSATSDPVTIKRIELR